MILGVHVTLSSKVLDDKKTAKTLSNAIVRDIDGLKLKALQVFTHGPRNFTSNKIDTEKTLSVTKDLNVTCHSAYPTVAIWRVTSANCQTVASQKLLKAFTTQLQASKSIQAWGLVIHICQVEPESIADTMQLLLPIAKKLKVKILLEIVASKASAHTYETPEKLDKVIKLIGPSKWYGITVDTAHLWSAGVNIRSYTDVKNWLDGLKKNKKILQFHLNGSSAKMGSGKDKHEIPFCSDDKIWHGIQPNKSGVRAIVEFATKNNIVVICEINRGKEQTVKYCIETLMSLS